MSGARRLAGSAFVAAYRAGCRAWSKGFSLLAAGAFAEFGQRSVIQPPVRLRGEARIAIGREVFVGGGSWLQVDPHGPEGAISIGDGTSIAGDCVLYSACSIAIGERVLMARNVYVSDHSHAFGDVDRAVLDQGIDRVRPVEIGDGAWIGQNVLIGPGVRVGRGAVVGANSVVLADVPAYAVAVGAPAVVVHSRVEERALAS